MLATSHFNYATVFARHGEAGHVMLLDRLFDIPDPIQQTEANMISS